MPQFEKYKNIIDKMATRAENLTNVANNEFVQQNARSRIKRSQDSISHQDTRPLRKATAEKEQERAAIRSQAEQTIARMGGIIERRGPQGRPRTRTTAETGEDQSLKSMASTVAKGQPKKK